jgi:hypothetical protein
MRNLIRRLLAMPLLTDLQRDVELETLSDEDCAYLAAYFADHFPAEFDVAVVRLASFRTQIGEAA